MIFHRYRNFQLFLAVLIAAIAASVWLMAPARALLIGFDCAALVYLARMARLFTAEGEAAMRQHAASNEPDHVWMVLLALIIIAVVLAALSVELRGMGTRLTEVVLAAATLTLTWLFANTLMTLHYAHVWYAPDGRGNDTRGLDFPDHAGEAVVPDYWDFAYFAFVIAMTFQVSDITITSRRLRRTVLVHSLLAFLYNIAIVALSVSLLAAALGG
ncbi:hypothetical protein IP88_05845 [alpha proteobacterium AAP81b]|nr:hypothetical protein IP88_05845 [alpha proteobacterium AAP81b]